MNSIVVPEGFRLLQPGELIQEGDLYLSTMGQWVLTPVFGSPVIENNVSWCRKI